MNSRHLMKKVQVPIIWTIAILFGAGVIWWSVATYIGGRNQNSNGESNTSVTISETVAYLTKDGTPLDNQDYWVTRADYEETVRNVLSNYASNGQILDSYFSSGQVPSEMGVRYSVTRSLLDERITNYYAGLKGVFPDEKTVETEAASYVKAYSEDENIKAAIVQQFGSMEAYQKLVEEAVAQNLLQENVKAAALPEVESEFEKYFEENKDSLKSEYEKVNANHILLTEEASALEIKSMIDAGEISFTDAASEFSQDAGSAANGGALGEFGRGQMVPEFEEAAFNGSIGTIVGPVESQFGYHLIEILNKVSFDTFEEFEKIADFDQIRTDFVNEKFSEWFAGYKTEENFSYEINDPDLEIYDMYDKAKSDTGKKETFLSILEEMIFNPEGELVLTDSYLPATLFVEISDDLISGMDSTLKNLNSMKTLYETLPASFVALTAEEVETRLASLTDDSTPTVELKQVLNDVKELRDYEVSTEVSSLSDVNTLLVEKQQVRDGLNEKFEEVVSMLYVDLPNSNKVVEYMYGIDSDNPSVVYRYYDATYSSDLKKIISDASTYEYYINYYSQYFGDQTRSYIIDFKLQRMESELNQKVIDSETAAKEVKAGALYILVDAYQNLANLPGPDALKELYIRGEMRYLEILKTLLPDDATIDTELQMAKELLTLMASDTSASATDTQD